MSHLMLQYIALYVAVCCNKLHFLSHFCGSTMEQTIFLIGFMGAGKSSFGKRLAKKMNRPFLDSDREIEKNTGRSVADWFEKEGETAFRQLETDWLEKLTTSNAVVALGGGTPCFNHNMERINQVGISIYLELSPKALADRLLKSKKKRPLIAPFQQDEMALLEFIETKLAQREQYYRQAHFSVSGVNLSADRLEELIGELKLKS